MLRRNRRLIAVLYWIFTALVYVGGFYQPNNEGGIPTVIVTLPWSIPMLMACGFLDSAGLFRPLLSWLATTTGNFIMFPVVCGGMNAVLIYGVDNLRDRTFWKSNKESSCKVVSS